LVLLRSNLGVEHDCRLRDKVVGVFVRFVRHFS
jgi:hypothetical protein